jgi:hypothetical protein
MKLFAIEYDRRGTARREAGESTEAIRLFEKAIAHAPDWSVPWYNLGLTYKYLHNWAESYRCNAEAVRLNPADEAAIWNMGIAATALGNWSEARRAWTLYGIEVPAGAGPPDSDLGTVPIRINPDGNAEVVWARRIDPARAVLTSIPLPESDHRHGDFVLHDGAPAGYRKQGDDDVPVFNELQVLIPSGCGTFEVKIEARSAEDLASFEEACEAHDCKAEDWSTLRVLCRACSEGHPHHHPDPPTEGEHRFAVAALDSKLVAAAVGDWVMRDPTRAAGTVTVLLDPLPLT